MCVCVHGCSRLLAFVCVLASALACVCQPLSAVVFACICLHPLCPPPPLCRPCLCKTRQNKVSRILLQNFLCAITCGLCCGKCLVKFAYPLSSGNAARKGPKLVAKHFSRQSSQVQNQNFMRIFTPRKFFPEQNGALSATGRRIRTCERIND